MCKLTAAVVVLVLINVCNALECYLCIGSTTSDCAKGTVPSFAKQTCPDPPPPGAPLFLSDKVTAMQQKFEGQKIVLKCVSTSLTVNATSIYTRGCGMIYEKADLCEFTKVLTEKVNSCKTCDANLCNAAP